MSRDREATFLAAAGRPYGRAGKCWATCARMRLEAGEAAYGGRWRTLGMSRLLEEIAEEAADVGSWSALAMQALDAEDLDTGTIGQVAASLEAAARAGADAYTAVFDARRELGARPHP